MSFAGFLSVVFFRLGYISGLSPANCVEKVVFDVF